MRTWVWIFTALLSLYYQAAEAVTIEQLRAGIAADTQTTPGQQYIHFGPMRDGRELSITTHMVNGSSAVGIAQIGRDTFVIHMGRSLVLNSIYFSDAMMICARFPQIACDRMADYVERVNASRSPAEAPFLEEVFPDLQNAARSSRTDETVYSASLQAGLQSLTSMVTLHEIGHAALHHLDHPVSDVVSQIGEEGEADGFAAYVAETAGMSPMGLVVPFLSRTVEETVTGKMPVVHPPSDCRAAVMTTKSIDWLQKNEAELLSPSSNQMRDELAKKMFDQITSENRLGELDATGVRNCKQYVVSFATGLTRAKRLVDQNTKIDSAVPGQQ